jgi:hypothetical protein
MTQPHEAEIARRPSRRTILLATGGALLTAALVLAGGVLPAEFGRDPTGLGRLLGTAAIWSPPETELKPAAAGADAPASRSFPQAWRSDVIDIPLKASGDPERGDELEYKVHLPKGGVYVYSWEVPGIANPEEFYTEFHGHTVIPGQEMTVAYYRKATGTADHGVLTAPFDGVHGWYFQNQSIRPVTVRLRLAGFYTLIPDGQPGNEAGLHARPVKLD